MGFTRRQVLTSAGLAVAGVAVGTKKASALSTNPISLGAMFKLIDNAAGTLVFQVRTDAPAYVRVGSDPAGMPSRLSAWTPTLSMSDPTGHPNTHEAQVTFAGCQLPGEAGSFVIHVSSNSTGSPLTTDPGRYTAPARPGVGSPSRFAFLAGSCQNTDYPTLREFQADNATLTSATAHSRDKGWPVFTQALTPGNWTTAGQPLEFFHIGDWGYPDATTAVAQEYEDTTLIGYKSANQWVKRHQQLRPLLQSMPVTALMDDHDYGQDGAYRGSTTTPVVPSGYLPAKGPYKDFAALAFQDTLPDYPFVSEGTQPPNRVQYVGQVAFLTLDNRKWADPEASNPSYWQNVAYWSTVGGGSGGFDAGSQMAWLTNQIAAAQAGGSKVITILSPRTFHLYYSRPERKALMNWLTAHAIATRLLWVTGDKHCQGHFQWVDHTSGLKMDEVLVCPLHQRTGSLSPFTTGQLAKDDDYTRTPTHLTDAWTFARKWPLGNPPPGPVAEVIGYFDVDTTGASPVIIFKMITGTGATLYSATI